MTDKLKERLSSNPVVLTIDSENYAHILDTARLTLQLDPSNTARELAELFLVFAKESREDENGVVKNAVLTSICIFADLTTVHVTLFFEYDGEVTQKAGPIPVTADVLARLSSVAGEREILKIANKPCRVRLQKTNGRDYVEVVSVGHFIRDEWLVLT